MGYRSDVAIVLAAESEEALKSAVSLWHMTDEYQRAIPHLGEIDEAKQGTMPNIYAESADIHYMMWRFQDVKWYGGYADVDAYSKLLSLVGDTFDEEDGVGVTFVRVGEERGDIDHDEYGDIDISEVISAYLYPVTIIKNEFAEE